MKLKTHLHIAETLHKDYESYLNKFVFKIGNCLPDLWLPLRLRSHYESGSGEYINTQIKKQLILPRGILLRSLQLGIISHFVTDFSCTVHKPESRCSTIDHMIYEKKLTQYHESGHRDIDEAIQRAGSIIYAVITATEPLTNMA